MHRSTRLLVLSVVAAFGCASNDVAAQTPLPKKTEFHFTSTLDGTRQPSFVWVPERAAKEKRPLMVRLHSWSFGYKQENEAWFREAVDREWIYLHPDFRGRNDHPEACGSKLARRDVLDAVQWAIDNANVDESRIYLCGVSGGGHMTMLMAGHHAERFSAASAWVGISDLAEWHRFHVKDGKPSRYAKMIAACTGGPPGTSEKIDAEYRDRSPIHHLHQVGDLPLDISAGVRDGKDGSVPVFHSLRAFNVVAKSLDAKTVSEEEMNQLWTDDRLKNPGEGENVVDPLYGRRIHLRRTAGKSRVTIFQGGHEGIADAACEWMSRHRRKTTAPRFD